MWMLLKNGQIIDPLQGIDKKGDLLIENGRVSSIGSIDDSKLKKNDGQVYDVSGLLVTPGLIDMHVHLREPGFEYKETIESGAQAAAAGGITTILAMPNTKPAVDNRAVVEHVLEKGKLSAVNVLTTGAATKANEGREMSEIGDMIAAGASAISDDAFPIQSADLMRRVMEYSKMFDVPVLTHCEDKSMTEDGVMNEGITCTILGLRPWPRQAEEIMIWRNILLAQLTGCRLHIQHLSTAGGVKAIKWAKSEGIRVTCETCPQYFSLTDEALNTYNTNAKINPPLRTQSDIETIKSALADGTIDVISTDHAPHALNEKEVEMQYASFGMVGLETSLSLVITNLVKTGVLTYSDAIRKMSLNPAQILGVNAGTLNVGSPADITIIDPDLRYKVNCAEFRSKGRNTPFDCAELIGKAAATIVYGEVVSGEDIMKDRISL